MGLHGLTELQFFIKVFFLRLSNMSFRNHDDFSLNPFFS